MPNTIADERRAFDAFRADVLHRTPRPIITMLLVGANVLVFGLMVFNRVSWISPDPNQLIAWGANFGPKTLNGEEWRLATCMFLHVGLVHLGMNMLALWTVGRLVEQLLGSAGFLLLYVVSGLAGSYGSVVFNPVVVSAGASGAIFGVAGGLMGGAWKIRKCLPPALLAAVKALGFNVLILLVIYAVVNHYQPMIDNAAHVAGFLAGVVIGLILAEPIPNPKPSRRVLRNFVVAVLGAAAGYAGFLLLPSPPADIEELETKFHRVELEERDIVKSADGRLRARAITEDEFADILERDVVSRWANLGDDFDAAGWIPEDYRAFIADLRKIIELRETGWQLEIEAHRERNPKKARESEQRFDEAFEIIRQINAKSKAQADQ